ncbi:MAG: hypothetical protein GQ477_01760 [Nanohaloarchaea archaeon]|nr:hypothetical protein [Candidatus Nanohaloarchaea archaeon]
MSSPLGYLINNTIMSVTIQSETNYVFYEDSGADISKDFVFQIGPIVDDGNWYSYNGSYGGIYRGYDIGIDSDNETLQFSIKNIGTTKLDVVIASSDFDNGIFSDTNFIDVNRTDGNFQIYIPGDGWRNVPDNVDVDDDRSKDVGELCIVDDLVVGGIVDGFDVRIRSPVGTDLGNYTANIIVSVVDSEMFNPCSGVGEYVDI